MSGETQEDGGVEVNDGTLDEYEELETLNTRILGPDDPRRMQLSTEERDWALDIKDVIEASPEISGLSDFMYAQLAIIHQDDIAMAVAVASRLQHTRQEYDVRDTLEDGTVKLRKLLRVTPGTNLSFSFSHDDGCFVQVVDLGKLGKNVVKDAQDNIASLAGSYYMNHCLTPDLEAVRKGVIFMFECDGAKLLPKLSELKYQEQYWSDIGIYPFRVHQYKFFHTPMLFNILKSLAKPFVPVDIYSKMRTGCRFDGRLDSLYVVPSMEATEQRFLGRILHNLSRRYENERAFSLS